ncbi:MAG: nucleoside monophosphate kinase [Candidatus Omnitrophica bacterium]|nr:nucleoside monophosphate kinase [Candidatus Omnitrophota bacterium]
MNVIVLGSQGSGKSTHAKYIAEKLGVPYINAGDLFRSLAKEDSEYGRVINQFLAKGLIVPDKVAIPIFERYLSSLDTRNGFVLDGYPRTIQQAESLKAKIDLVIHVLLQEQEAIRRLLERRRVDDTPQLIRNRLEFYKKETLPLIDYFKRQKIKIENLDNTSAVEIVRGKIDDLLEKYR